MSTYPNDPMLASLQVGDIAADSGDETTVVDISTFRASRYERNSRSLPHLGDDPNWTPATFELPRPIADDTPRRWFDRFRR
jgi:hypothetical protein